jgi:hypothetical protein
VETPTIDGKLRYDPGDGDDPTQRLDESTAGDRDRAGPPPRGAPPRQSAGGHPPRPPSALLGLRQKPWRRVLSFPVLYAMAAADAFGFWNTLSQIIKRDAALVLVFVFALSIGAVAVPHVAGQLLKSRLVGFGGSLVWIGVLGAVWMSLGVVMCWLRWSTPTSTTGPRSGQLAAQVAAAGSRTDNAMHLAVLLMVLFLLTGALAMTHGFRFGDPRSPELRAAIAQRAELEKQIAEHRLSVADAEGDLQKNLEDQQRAKRSRTYEHEIDQARVDELRSQARQFVARHVADPDGTDRLNQDWPPTAPLPRGRAEFTRTPPDFDGPAEVD